MSKYVNILNDDENRTESSMESESGVLKNDTLGECPKCQSTMGKARIASHEEVYYCKTCRVSSPIEASE